VLCGFLLFAGVGSGFSPQLVAWVARGHTSPTTKSGWDRIWLRLGALEVAIGGIAVVTLLYLYVLPPLFALLTPLPDAPKVAIALLLIAPLAFCMGMPFPLALSRVSTWVPGLVPWAWGINGCASVLSAILATLLAMNVGFTWVMLIAIALYLVAAAVFRRPLTEERS
jgi:hypothetical protein